MYTEYGGKCDLLACVRFRNYCKGTRRCMRFPRNVLLCSDAFEGA